MKSTLVNHSVKNGFFWKIKSINSSIILVKKDTLKLFTNLTGPHQFEVTSFKINYVILQLILQLIITVNITVNFTV